MKFIMLADFIFEADEISDAFEKVAQHFLNLYNDEDSKLGIGGEVRIIPFKEQTHTIITMKELEHLKTIEYHWMNLHNTND